MIKNFIANFKKAVYRAFDKVGANSEAAKAILQYTNELQALWDNALVGAVHNQQGKGNVAQGEQAVKFEKNEINKTKSKKSTYNEFNTLVMQWSNHPDRQSGDVKMFSRKGKFVLVEAMNDGGYFEVVSGTYERVQKEYERIHGEKDTSFYEDTKEIRTDKRGDMWNLQPDEERGNGTRNSKSFRGKEFQYDTAGNTENLHGSNKGKSVKYERVEITEDEVIRQSQRAMAAELTRLRELLKMQGKK